MADPEKLTALKKAYADTILNTAKEAAARVMVSERKARGYQQELVAVRDEALRTLLRLKQMFDSKVKEAEMVSLKQQKKIEELEAQLGEAEDIVGELRMELRELQDELEKATNSQMHRRGEENDCWENGEAVGSLSEDNISHEKLKAVGSADLVGQRGMVMTNGIQNLFLNRMENIGRCCYKDNGNGCHHSLPSILTRHKEAEMFRKGCARMIHSLERSISSRNFSTSGRADDGKYEEYDGGKKEKACAVILPQSEGCKVPSYKSFPNQIVETLQMSDCSDDCDSPSSDENDVRYGGNEQVSLNYSQKYSDSPISSKTLSSARESNRKLLIGKTASGKEKNGNDENIVSAFLEEGPSSPADKRCIKYTFKRKRKKDSLSSPDRDLSLDEIGLASRRKTEEKDNGYLQSLKSSLITESSHDS